jgi:hypothetical protein
MFRPYAAILRWYDWATYFTAIMLIHPLFSISSSCISSSCIAATVYVFIVLSHTAFPSHYIDTVETCSVLMF